MAFGDLTTLADVKTWLQTGQNPFPATDDVLLARLITAASGFIQHWLGRQILSGDWIEIRDGDGGPRLVFANFPVTAVWSLTIDGLTIPPVPQDRVFGAGYTFSPTELALRGYVFTRRPQNVAVTYTAGYAAVPSEIAQTCIELVCRRYRERTRIGEAAKALGNENVRFLPQDIGGSIKTALLPYRSAAPVSAFARTPAPSATDPAILVGAL
jgi:hypothetical protein